MHYETAPMKRLDNIVAWLALDEADILLKVDVQGFEKNVFEGAQQFLPRVKVIFLAVSLIPVYHAETPYLEMLTWLRD